MIPTRCETLWCLVVGWLREQGCVSAHPLQDRLRRFSLRLGSQDTLHLGHSKSSLEM